jgi:hypothetical protein
VPLGHGNELDCSTPAAMTMTFGNVSLQFPCLLDNSQNTKYGISTTYALEPFKTTETEKQPAGFVFYHLLRHALYA